MSDNAELRHKLREVLGGTTPDYVITQIEQAFAYAGYVQVPTAYKNTDGTLFVNGTIKVIYHDGTKLMTGQEWYDKFERLLPEPYRSGNELNPRVPSLPEQRYMSLGSKEMHHGALQAARYASGIDARPGPGPCPIGPKGEAGRRS